MHFSNAFWCILLYVSTLENIVVKQFWSNQSAE